MAEYFTIRWLDGIVRMLDQRRLPHSIVYLDYRDVNGVASAIQEMVIRGAPAIGCAAAYGLALQAFHTQAKDVNQLNLELEKAAEILIASRPTAINLAWAIKQIMLKISWTDTRQLSSLRDLVIQEALLIAENDVKKNRQIGKNALDLIPDQAKILHHCNTGALATVDFGTALGVIRTAHEHGKNIHVYVDETRPRLQGARLTSWELKQLGIPHTVIVDGASGYFMRTVGIDLCLIGCDRIAANGDVVNKIGSYNLALAAHAHGVPFYSVGPISTIDLSVKCGDDIPIENRSPEEVSLIGDTQITPIGVDIANPAFDITPARFITGIITECGVAYPPLHLGIKKIFSQCDSEVKI